MKKMANPITLYPTQVNHVRKLFLTLKYLNVAFDTSETGSGKTYVAIYLLHEMISEGLCNRVVFILPHESRKTWEKLSKMLPIPCTTYVHTMLPRAIGLVDDKTIVVIDEVQVLSSINERTSNLKNVINDIKKGRGRVLSISATPSADYRKIYNLLYNLQIIDLGPKPTRKMLADFGFAAFARNLFTRTLSIEAPKEELDSLGLTKQHNPLDIPAYGGTIANMISAIYELVLRIYGSQCPRFLPPRLVMKSFNMIYELHPDDFDSCCRKLQLVNVAPGLEVPLKLRDLHWDQLPYIADAGLRVLRANTHGKIILCVLDNQHVCILKLFFVRLGYACETIKSDVSKLDRNMAQEAFNQYDTTYRVLIVTFTVANCGISLHDSAPRDIYPNGFPRTMISFIDTNSLRRTQLLGRHIRTGITSDVVTTIMLSTTAETDGKSEMDILYSKSKADIDLITLSMESTEESSSFRVMTSSLHPDLNVRNKIGKIIEQMEEHLD